MLAIEKEEKGPLLLLKTVIRRAELRVGSHEYRELYIGRPELGEEEVIYNGEYACAYETTAALHNLGLLKATHTTVNGFEREAKRSVWWVALDHYMSGAIGILEKKIHLDGSLGTRHTFTCVGNGYAVHNDADLDVRSPQRIAVEDFRHHTGMPRKVDIYYIHRKLLA